MNNKKIYFDVNIKGCIGCGNCIFVCNKGFSFNKDRKSIPIKLDKEEFIKIKKDLKIALQGCPVNVISEKK